MIANAPYKNTDIAVKHAPRLTLPRISPGRKGHGGGFRTRSTFYHANFITSICAHDDDDGDRLRTGEDGVHQREGQHDEGDEDVGDRQVGDEVVRHRPHLAVPVDHRDDEAVVDDTEREHDAVRDGEEGGDGRGELHQWWPEEGRVIGVRRRSQRAAGRVAE